MHERIRATGQSRARLTQPTSEDWHDLSRYVAALRAASVRDGTGSGGGSADRNG